jgi:hypothetical protein
MSTVLKTVSNVFSKNTSRLLQPLENNLLGTTVRVALILYASLIAPELPDYVSRQLEHTAVRSVLIFLIAYLAIKDPITAALATLALMVSIMSLHRSDVRNVLTTKWWASKQVANPMDVPVAPMDATVAPMDVPVAPMSTTVAPMDVPVGVETEMDTLGSL